MNNRIKIFIKNLLYAFVAQGLSFILSALMSIIVPKVLSVNDFGYWQLFIFYTSYVGFFHFGFNDGIYLLNGGKNYDELNYNEIGGAFWISFFVQLILGVVFAIICSFFNMDFSRKLVLYSTVIYMLIFNSSFCLGYIFQATNDTKTYSKSVMIDKICFMFLLFFLLLFKINNYIWFIVAYIISKFISYIYSIYYGKEIFFVKNILIRKSIRCYIESVRVGFNLTIASVASMLILGIGRMIIDYVWGIEEFAKFSLVLSLASFAIMFISQVSMVLFPSLRQVSKEQQKNIYYKFRSVLSVVLPMIFVVSIPVKVIMQIWLPEYSNSLNYLILALPICFFDAKMNLLCNTYFKVLREEKYLRKINISSFIFSIVFCSICGFCLKNSVMVLLSMVCAITFRSIVSEMHLAKIMNYSIIYTLICEVMFIVIIMILAVTFIKNDILLFFCILILYCIFLLINKKSLHLTKSLLIGVISKT